METGSSFYKSKIKDNRAVYLDAYTDLYSIREDGSINITEALQEAIRKVKTSYNFGIVFIPEGIYYINQTIYIPKAIRLIGFGNNRPLIILEKDSPGFQDKDSYDKGMAKYMFWFTNNLPDKGEDVKDAGAGTFYSAISNINLKIEEGNQAAVALRTHFAQHCFVSHMDIYIGTGKAGIFDVGNEIEDVRFYGGRYGIYTTKTSPGWPFVMLDTYFEGQENAAIKTQEAGLTILRMKAKNTAKVIEINSDRFEKLYFEDCQFQNITDTALLISMEGNAHTQVNLKNIDCKQVEALAYFRESGRKVESEYKMFRVNSFTHGSQIDDINALPEVKTTYEIQELKAWPNYIRTDIPEIPAVDTWVNIKELGAKGDGITDDTEIIKDAVDRFSTIYLPQGWYRVSDTITLKQSTVLIGLNPVATQIVLKDNTEPFAGFGEPKPLLEVPEGGSNIVSGIGLDTGGRNPRAVACKWMAAADSYMNDVKFIGGHGSMSQEKEWIPVYNQDRTADANPDLKWDSQYWSLWVTNGGGGIFKDIWTASPYSAAGMYVSDTSTPGRIYAMSVEHHVRNEVVFRNVANWQVYTLQLEEEIAEGKYCQPLEIIGCRNLTFANFYSFRVIWVHNPYPYAIKVWNFSELEFLNLHNFAQNKYTITNTLVDVNSELEVRPWEISRLSLSGNREIKRKSNTNSSEDNKYEIVKLASGFEFADGICKDSKGNVYFCDSNFKRVYKWDVHSNKLELVNALHFKPLLLACDNEDNLLVVCEYLPPVDAIIDGEPEVYPKPEDAEGTSYGYWYNTGSTTKVYSLDPENPEKSMNILELQDVKSANNIEKALHPANRWRDSNDYLEITTKKPEKIYLAGDGRTVIPECYDLIRANSLLEAYPEKLFYAIDEYNKRTVKFEVTEDGSLTNPEVFTEKGEFGLAIKDEKIYIADGQVYIFDKDGSQIDELVIPERPVNLIFAGKESNQLYITTRSSLYRVKEKI